MKVNPCQDIIGVLKANSVDFEELDHEPVYTSEDAAKVRGLTMESGAKSLLLKTNDKFLLVVIAGNKKLDSKKLKRTLNVKKIRFANSDEVENKMGCKVGACYPFGGIAHLDTYLDNSLLNQFKISFNPGVHHKSIKIKLNDYLRIEKPHIIDVSAE
jgi:Ala-tRNA(Pro) deacylase